MSDFAARLIRWQEKHGRHDLPWQRDRDPYRVWLSEIMLQQTQVGTVIPYYARFLARFPDLACLAAAPVEDVMSLWSGLGYYARARNLHACARVIMAEHGGQFPRAPDIIATLPGIGRSTANAIAVFCFGARVPILDGNVKRLLCRHGGIEGFPGQPAVERQLWQIAKALLPEEKVDVYIQGQMDLGATVCTRTRPACAICPLGDDCVARAQGRAAELPTSRPRKAAPVRSIGMLILMSDTRVLVEQRPPAGIWGGLLSLPEFPVEGDPAAAAMRYGCRIIDRTARPAVTHAFTHFRLHIHPLVCRVEVAGVTDSTVRWLAPAELDDAALPAPVRQIIAAAGS